MSATGPSSPRTNAALLERLHAATPRGVKVLSSFFAARAENAELWDVEGRRYLDWAGGIAVVNTGHRHPKVLAAARAQLEAFTHVCYQVVPYEGYAALAERLNALVPGRFAKKTAFFSTGAEATENAVKIARAATGRPGVIAFSGAFHGRTFMAMALTGKVSPYKLAFGPFPGDVFHVPFPVGLHGTTVADTLRAVEHVFATEIDPARVAALIIEPVQGEGGFYVAPKELLVELRRLCSAHGIVYVVDEIQTGFGRTGRWFAHQHAGVEADLVPMAKSLAGGFPLSAVTGRAELMDAAQPGGLGGTYAGNPVAIAAALAVLDVIEEEQLNRRSEELGERLRARLESLRAEVPAIAEVRGLGGMVAVEFNAPGTTRPDAAFARDVQQRALDGGLLLLTCGVHGNVIRFLFPLTIPPEHFEEGLDILTRALRSAGAPAPAPR